MAISHYFKKHYGFAVGITVSGGCLGSLILPPIYRVLLDTYGLRGALLLAAGILSHSLVMACLLRPIEFYKRRKLSIIVNPKENSIPKPDVIPNKLEHDLKFGINGTKSQFTCELNDTLSGSQPIISKTPQCTTNNTVGNSMRTRTVSEVKDFKPGTKTTLKTSYQTCDTASKLSMTSLFKYVSLDNVANVSILSIHSLAAHSIHYQSSEDIQDERQKCFHLNFSFFKDPSFILLICVHLLGTLAPALIPAFIPISAKENGLTNTETVIIVTVLGASEFIGRIFIGFCSDRPWIKNHRIIIVTQIVAGVAANCNRYFTTFGSIIAFVIIFGTNAGAIFCVIVPILTDIVGLENFKSGYAFLMLTQCPLSAIMPFVFGK